MKVWENLQRTGVHHADGRRIDEFFRKPYRWLVGEMIEKIGRPPAGVRYPIWAWHTCEGRRGPGRYRPGPDPVLMRIEIPDDQVVLSNFDTWHYVLNDTYLSVTDRESDAILTLMDSLRARPNEDLASRFERAKRISWQRIFEINRRWRRVTANDMIQATFWELRLDQVERVWFRDTSKEIARNERARREYRNRRRQYLRERKRRAALALAA